MRSCIKVVIVKDWDMLTHWKNGMNSSKLKGQMKKDSTSKNKIRYKHAGSSQNTAGLPSEENFCNRNPMGDRRSSATEHEKLKRKLSVKSHTKNTRASGVYPERFVLEKQYTFAGYNLKITQTSDIDFHTSAVVWDADVLLCEYFEKMDISFFGKKVIELCSGTGIVGILAVLFGGEVTMTDRPSVLKQMQHNVSVNIPTYLAHRATITAFKWDTEEMLNMDNQC
uniref:Protein-lysine methyltransferase METTL21B-like n=2 Tax=Callorhinchus milii TaxID=7868 RepID=A0A4W3J438_CALMI